VTLNLRAIPVVFLAFASSAVGDEVDDYIRAEMSRSKTPGVAIAISRGGQVVRAQGYGLANVEHQVATKPETVFQSGSVGKQFTSMAVLMLVEGGKLSLDDPISKHFSGAPAKWAPITIRHLLTHTSGIKDWESGTALDLRRDYTEDQLVKIAMELPLDFPPGTQWSYSNTGYVLLGVLVHKVSGQFYGDLLQERVFRPLGMTSTRIIAEADIVPHRAAGYVLDKGTLKNQDWVSPSLNTTADGSLYLTVLDMAKWDAALYGSSLVKPETLKQAFTPVRLANGSSHDYGFGWDVDEQRGHRLIEHGGSWQGFRSAIARYVDDSLGVFVLANLAEAEPEAMAHVIAGIVEPSLRLKAPTETSPDPDAKRTTALLALLEERAAGAPSPLMAASLRQDDPRTEQAKASRKRLGELVRSRKTFAFLAEDDVAAKGLTRRGARVKGILHYGLTTADRNYALRFFVDDAGLVSDFTLEGR
jgi:CubicO group peptidase (beta-lactamase class C family)